MVEVETIHQSVEINIVEMRNLIDLAIRRVSAFVRFGLDDLDQRDGGDFSLSATINYSFWPSDVSESERALAREEFRAWLIGSSLKELDSFYSLFLDKIWLGIQVANLHGLKIRSDYKFDNKFQKKTNVAEKQRIVSEKLDIGNFRDELNSLSLARNSLTHHMGIVRSPNDCNDEKRKELRVKWLRFILIASREGHEIEMESPPLDLHKLKGEGPVVMAIRYSPQERVFIAGEQVCLSNADIAELCMFYKNICNQTIEGFNSLLKSKGIVNKEVERVEEN